MPRRRRSSSADDFMSAMSRLPWWASVAVGVAAYLLLHRFASRPFPTSLNPHEIGSSITGSMLRSLAMAGQYFIPILCAGAAFMSYVTRRKRRELFLQTTDGGDIGAAIDAMSWQDFERLLSEAFRLQGFVVSEKGGAGADGGIDLELTRNGERYLVQAKHWRAKQVPVEVVRELAGVMPFRRAVGGYVVTSGRFTGPAAEFAEGRGIRLVTGTKLAGMLQQARDSLDGMRAPVAARHASTPRREATEAISLKEDTGATVVPSCPSCGATMKLRVARKGDNVGRAFWGCSSYPNCRATRAA